MYQPLNKPKLLSFTSFLDLRSLLTVELQDATSKPMVKMKQIPAASK